MCYSAWLSIGRHFQAGKSASGKKKYCQISDFVIYTLGLRWVWLRWLEHQVVALGVAGSSPAIHPKSNQYSLSIKPGRGKHPDRVFQLWPGPLCRPFYFIFRATSFNSI